jgi:tetratricopeptide (TPR) repeat protein
MRAFLLVVCVLTPLLGVGERPAWREALARAEALKQARDFAAAETILLSTLEQARSAAPSDPRLGVLLNSLGSLYLAEGKYLDARRTLEGSLPILERALGTDHVYLAQTVLNNLGMLYSDRGEYAKAERVLGRALAITNAAGRDAETRANLEDGLAAVYVRHGRYDEAKLLFDDALALERRTLGPYDARVAGVLNNQAALLFKTGNTDAALAASKEALRILEPQAASRPADLAQVLNNLGLFCGQSGSLAEAEAYYRRALAIAEPAFGADHPVVGSLLEGYGDLLRRMHRKSEAKAAERRAKSIQARNARDNALGLTVDARSLVESQSARP